MSPIILDTHVAVWSATNDRKLGRKARRLIEKAIVAERAWISAVSFWEITLLVLRDDIEIDGTMEEWRRRALAGGLRELPLTGDAAIRGAQALPYHHDPSDRQIVGACLVMGAMLVTSDSALLDWAGAMARVDASRRRALLGLPLSGGKALLRRHRAPCVGHHAPPIQSHRATNQQYATGRRQAVGRSGVSDRRRGQVSW